MKLARMLKNHFRDGFVGRKLRRRSDRKTLLAWENEGRSQPPPQVFKQQLIREVAERFRIIVLVETGTHLGDTVAASLDTFDTIYSVELMEELYLHAQRRFAGHRRVKLRHGDSARELARILDELTKPAVFWLDAHYSGDGTARAAVDTPIVAELQAISRHSIGSHPILIDDARLFDGTHGYPTLNHCRQLAERYWPEAVFNVADDVIRILPSTK